MSCSVGSLILWVVLVTGRIARWLPYRGRGAWADGMGQRMSAARYDGELPVGLHAVGRFGSNLCVRPDPRTVRSHEGRRRGRSCGRARVRGSFTTPDSLDGQDGTTTVANPYTYANNDPLNQSDPLGLRAHDDGWLRVIPPASRHDGDACSPPFTASHQPIVYSVELNACGYYTKGGTGQTTAECLTNAGFDHVKQSAIYGIAPGLLVRDTIKGLRDRFTADPGGTIQDLIPIWGSLRQIDNSEDLCHELIGAARLATEMVALSEAATAQTPSKTGTVDDLLPSLPSSGPRPVGLGSTGRTAPANPTEQLTMTEVRSAPAGSALTRIVMNGARWPAADGWVKLRQVVNGVDIHYVRNTVAGSVDDFKFAS